MYDVAIIGAGPSGSYTAYLLAKKGYNVILLDRQKEPDPEIGYHVGYPTVASSGLSRKDGVVCTGIVSKEAFKRFLLPEDTIIDNISSVSFISPYGEKFRYEHSSIFAYILDRSSLDFSLLKQVLKKGITFLPGCNVEDLKIKKDYTEIYYRCNGKFQCKQSESIKARVSVIATGLNLFLLNKTGLKGPQDFLIGAQVETNFDGSDEVEIYLGNKVAPKSFAWVVPLGNGRARIGLSMKGDAISYLRNFLKTPSIKERLREGKSEIKCRPIPFGPAQRTYGLRIVSVGDAAGQVKTTTGGGIYYGLIGAEIAAQTLCEALDKGDLIPSTLKVYEKRWREILGSEINIGIRLREIYAMLGDRKIDHLIKIANSDGIAPLIKNKARFDWQKRFFHSLLSKPIIKRILET